MFNPRLNTFDYLLVPETPAPKENSPSVDNTVKSKKALKKAMSKLVLRVDPLEKSRLVVQIGSACPDLALQAARMVEKDCAEVNLNCGCPKKFSISGGMGAALLSSPDTLVAILENLVRNLSIPVSAKIRLLHREDDPETVDVARTLELMHRIARAGASNITVHFRVRDQRPREPAHWGVIQDILKGMKATGIPLNVNGDIYTKHEMEKLKAMGTATSSAT